MPSSEKWLRPKITGDTTTMNSEVVMSVSDVNNLYEWVLNNPIESAIFGDYTKWCSSLQFYPFKINISNTTYKLSVGGVQSSKILCNGLIPVNAEFGYTLGQIYYPTPVSYLDYEPFTKVEIWLPFYGFTELRIADIAGKYIQFRLYIDFHSGSAQYVIGVTDSALEFPNAPFALGADDTNTRIIGTCVFQLGYTIPLGSTGLADTVRNIALTGIKAAASFATGAIVGGITGGAQTSKTITTTTSKNAEGKQITAERESTTTTEHDSNYNTVERIGTTMKTAQNVLESLNVRPSVDR